MLTETYMEKIRMVKQWKPGIALSRFHYVQTPCVREHWSGWLVTCVLFQILLFSVFSNGCLVSRH